MREAVEQGASRQVALLLQTLQHTPLQLALQGIELARERRQARLRLGWLDQREGHAPHLRTFVPTEGFEELRKAREQVALGDDHIHREAQAQALVQLIDARTDRYGLGLTLSVGLLQQVADAQGHDHTVDRALATVLFQQVEEATPRGLVHFGVAVLGGVAPGSVEQHRFIGEPPIAMPRAADTADGTAAHGLAQGKLQPGMGQRRGLAAARRADEHVPRQLI